MNDLLIEASRAGNLEKIIECLEAGADVHAMDDYALRVACLIDNDVIVEILLKYGADVHAEDDQALRTASSYGNAAIVKLLLDYGADKDRLHDEATPEMWEYIPVNRRRVLVVRN